MLCSCGLPLPTERGVLYLPAGLSGAMWRWISGLGPCGHLRFQLLVTRQDILGEDVAPQQHLVFAALVNGDPCATSSPVVKVFLRHVFHSVCNTAMVVPGTSDKQIYSSPSFLLWLLLAGHWASLCREGSDKGKSLAGNQGSTLHQGLSCSARGARQVKKKLFSISDWL